MQGTTAHYKQLLAGEHYFETKVTIAGTYVFTEHQIVSLSTSTDMIESSSAMPSVGNAPSAQIDLELVDESGYFDLIPRMASIEIKIRPVNRNTGDKSDLDWIKKGTYYIDTRKINNQNVMTIHGYDAMLKADEPMLNSGGQEYTWPWTAYQVLDYIAKKIGVDLDGNLDEDDWLHSYIINYPGYGEDGYSMRNMIKYIGSMVGANFFINDSNALTMSQLSATNLRTPYIIGTTGDCNDLSMNPKGPKVIGVECSTGESSLEQTVGVDRTEIQSVSPPIYCKGSATVKRDNVADKNITASVNLEFEIPDTGSSTHYTDFVWKYQLAWSNNKDNRSDYFTLNDRDSDGNLQRWYEGTIATANGSVKEMQWINGGTRTLHIYVYKDNIALWTKQHYYAKGAIVKHSSSYYSCKTAHTSTTSFTSKYWTKKEYRKVATLVKTVDVVFDRMPEYNDTGKVDETSGSLVYRTLKEGYTYWKTNTSYTVGDTVIYGGSDYACKSNHTSRTFFDTSKWTQEREGIIFKVASPWMNQTVSDNLFSLMEDFQYQGYEISEYIGDPAIEIGDYIQLGSNVGPLSYILNVSTELGYLPVIDISAPEDSQFANEYDTKNSIVTRDDVKNIANSIFSQFASQMEEDILESTITGTVSIYDSSYTQSPSTDDLQVGDCWESPTGWVRWDGQDWESTRDRTPAAWKAKRSYTEGDFVEHNGYWYKCTVSNTDSTWTSNHWAWIHIIETDATSMISQSLDNITLSVKYADSKKDATITLEYGNISLTSEAIDIFGKLLMHGNVYRVFPTGVEGAESPYFLIGKNNSSRLQIGSANAPAETTYQGMSVYGNGNINFMTEPNDVSVNGADVVINPNGVKIKSIGSSSANNNYIIAINSDGQLIKTDKKRSDIGSGGTAVFG